MACRTRGTNPEERGRLTHVVRSLIEGSSGFLGRQARVLHARVDRPQGCVGVRIAGLCMRTAIPLSADERGAAGGSDEKERPMLVVTSLIDESSGFLG